MRKIELTDEQFKNLTIFLGRASMSGTEAPAFVGLLAALDSAPTDAPAPEKKAK